MEKIQHVIQGLYGIAESEKMLPKESVRFTLRKTVECLEKALGEHDREIRNATIGEFAKLLKEHVGRHYVDCDGYFGGIQEEILYADYIDEIAEELKCK